MAKQIKCMCTKMHVAKINKKSESAKRFGEKV